MLYEVITRLKLSLHFVPVVLRNSRHTFWVNDNTLLTMHEDETVLLEQGIRFVITSYSIHYTKLYEAVFSSLTYNFLLKNKGIYYLAKT